MTTTETPDWLKQEIAKAEAVSAVMDDFTDQLAAKLKADRASRPRMPERHRSAAHWIGQ